MDELQQEKEYLSAYDITKYDRPAVTVDNVIIAHGERILLIKRRNFPYKGAWALPGGFAERGETLEHAAQREVLEETGLNVIAPRLSGVYSAPGRDPRGWIISCAFLADLSQPADAASGDDAEDAEWFTFEQIDKMQLAFDHKKIIDDALKIIRS